MTSSNPQMPESPSFKCPQCDADLLDPANPYCEKCDITWMQCPECNRFMPPGRSTCEECGMTIPDKGA